MPGSFESDISSSSEELLSLSVHHLGNAQTGHSGNPTASQVPTVLLVDDDDDSLILLGHILKSFVCNVVGKSDGHAILNFVKQVQPALIMLDIWLHDINGLDIVRDLKQTSATRSIPIVAVTALAQQRDHRRILQAGCAHYISKPYLIEDMEAVLEQYLTVAAE